MEKTSFFKRVDRVFESGIVLLCSIAGFLLFFCLLIVVADVIGRYFLGKPLIWVYYYSEYILVYSTFLAATYVLRHEGHVKVDLVVALLNEHQRRYLSLFSSFAGLFVSVVIGWFCLAEALDTLRQKTMFTAPVSMYQFPIKIIIPFGFLLLSLEWIRKLILTFSSLSDKGSDSGELTRA